MRAGHGKNVCSPIDQRCCKWLAAQTADVDTFLCADLHRVQARRLAANGVHTSGGNFNVLAVANQPPKEPFRDWAAANVACADEEDIFHGSERAASVRESNVGSNRAKSI